MDHIRPKKHLGQHFLKDDNLANKIVNSLSGDVSNILEIGPGEGILTKYLLHLKDTQIVVVEIDSDAVKFLIKEYPL
ncbi:MAG: 16S rRNA (adenine(1518)-N(6)/adenine(1519)-N(6))-dimethyltransferase, partial [Bacteroidales bacterium]|nr:16S rRNA (adenine(1518)-N(6)/adenine(1519)-N(6))-dimethyltransferase [Bacteroidales bacterium]